MGSRRRGSASSTLPGKRKMEIHLAIMLLLATGVLGQEEDAPAQPECDKDCEESWLYVEFLKKDITGTITEILTEDFKTTQDVDKTVSKTMEKVMKVRESILKRIKDIRKGEEQVCFGHNVKQEEKLSEFRMDVMAILLKIVDLDANSVENLREIGDALIAFRLKISQEVMRVLMLPAPCNSRPPPDTKCPECDALQKLKTTLEKVRDCATEKKADEEQTEDAGEGAPEGGEEDGGAEGGEECVEPPMFAMEFIQANGVLDEDIALLYTQIIETTNETIRTESLDMLTMLKEQREKIDVHISNLLEEENPEKIKKYVTSSMRSDIININIKYEDCLEKNCKGTPSPCDSCGATKVDEMRDKMREYTANLDSQREEEDKKEFIREDLINYINGLNTKSSQLLKKKVESADGKLEKCDQEELQVINDCKGPMWMLVNTTIFESLEEVRAMVVVMDEQLKEKRGDFCDNDEGPPPTDDNNCEWEEYEHTKKFLIKVDDVIQKGLFKNADKTNTLIGFVETQSMFDERVKKLFVDEVRCPGELDQIKKKYMVLLNKCMVEFMRPSVDFANMSRFQRIQCIKGLRNELEDRTAQLLQYELNNSLKAIDEAPGSA